MPRRRCLDKITSEGYIWAFPRRSSYRNGGAPNVAERESAVANTWLTTGVSFLYFKPKISS